MLPTDECKAAIFAHEKVGCAVSGGKDSMAVAMHLRPFWPQITFYWSNPGDPLPESLAMMEAFEKEVPHFVQVLSNVREDHKVNGYPSDVVPENMTAFHELITGEKPVFHVQHRISCCGRNFYAPLHNRILEDGVTLLIRGEKSCDHYRNQVVVPGYIDTNGVEYLLPAWDMTTDQVLDYMKLYPQYLGGVYEFPDAGGIDCMHCTAWWQEISMPYLRKYHPEAADQRMAKMRTIKSAVLDLINFVD